MSWLRLDDDMLDHPKWVRAIRDGGSSALHLWLALCSWCSRHLTDGVIPADIVPTLTTQWRSRDRTRALQALETAGLIAKHEPDASLAEANQEPESSLTRATAAPYGIHIVDYLERNPSRAETIERRGRKADSQKNHAVRKKLTGQHPVVVVDDRPAPDPLPIPSRPDPVPTPGREREPALLQPSKRDQELDAQAYALSVRGQPRHRFSPEFIKGGPTKANQAEGHMLGLTDEEIWARFDLNKNKYFPSPFDDDEAQFSRELAFAKADKEKHQFKSRAERDAFEMPGRERRA